jgi:hypothetical protein
MTSREKKQKTDRNTHTHTYTKERKAEHETDDEMAIGSHHIISSIPRRKRGKKSTNWMKGGQQQTTKPNKI